MLPGDNLEIDREADHQGQTTGDELCDLYDRLLFESVRYHTAEEGNGQHGDRDAQIDDAEN